MNTGDKRLNELLKWGIENSEDSRADPNAAEPQTNLTPDVLNALMGGPSEADLMRAAMQLITSDEEGITLEDKVIAFDNFEQLIENLDNANNIANLSLWEPLLAQLQHKEREIRKMAAWSVGTAVQNHNSTQEKLLAMGGIPRLVEMATQEDEFEDVRRKAVYALSSAVRNNQPNMDVCAEELTKNGRPTGKTPADDMEAINVIMQDLRDKAAAVGKN